MVRITGQAVERITPADRIKLTRRPTGVPGRLVLVHPGKHQRGFVDPKHASRPHRRAFERRSSIG